MYKSLSANQLNEKYRSNGAGDDAGGGGGGGECSTRGSSAMLQLNHDFNELRRMMRELDEQEAVDKKSRNRTMNLNTSAMGTELLETSPIKSLSNLVSAPIKMPPLKSTPIDRPSTSSSPATACNCANSPSNKCEASDCRSRPSTSSEAINRVERSLKMMQRTFDPVMSNKLFEQACARAHYRTNAGAHLLNVRRTKATELQTDQPSTSKTATITELTAEPEASPENSIDMLGSPETLAEASRNLTKTLRKLSKEVFSGKSDSVALVSSDEKRRSSNQSSSSKSTSSGSDQSRSGSQKSGSSSSGFGSGAVIESMRNHGIYSGTFSGTLNPALQDRYGRPKRDISTVIHILNDLLSATPHYSRGARISFEPAPPRKHVSIFIFYLYFEPSIKP